MRCPACGAPINTDHRFCSICGSELASVRPADIASRSSDSTGHTEYCPACGASVNSLDSFCDNCGTSLIDEQKERQQQLARSQTARDIGASNARTPMPAAPTGDMSRRSDSRPTAQETRQSRLNASHYPISDSINDRSVVEGRSFLFWLIISICTFGIGFIVYIYLTLDDMRRHIQFDGHSDQERHSQNIRAELIAVASLFLVGIPFYFYVKYNAFDKHLRYEHGTFSSKLANAWTMVILFVVSLLFTSVLIGIIGWIIIIYLEYDWQEKFNRHILTKH